MVLNLSPVDPQALYVQHVFFSPTEPSQMVLKTFIFDNSSHSPKTAEIWAHSIHNAWLSNSLYLCQRDLIGPPLSRLSHPTSALSPGCWRPFCEAWPLCENYIGLEIFLICVKK